MNLVIIFFCVGNNCRVDGTGWVWRTCSSRALPPLEVLPRLQGALRRRDHPQLQARRAVLRRRVVPSCPPGNRRIRPPVSRPQPGQRRRVLSLRQRLRPRPVQGAPGRAQGEGGRHEGD